LNVSYGATHSLTLIIEAFGMESDEYRQAKEVMLPRAKYLGPVFGIFPNDLAAANAADTARRLQSWVIDQVRHAGNLFSLSADGRAS
jgi:hypothetical protein